MFDRMKAYEQGKKDYEKGIAKCPYSDKESCDDWSDGWSYALHHDKDDDRRNKMREKWYSENNL